MKSKVPSSYILLKLISSQLNQFMLNYRFDIRLRQRTQELKSEVNIMQFLNCWVILHRIAKKKKALLT